MPARTHEIRLGTAAVVATVLTGVHLYTGNERQTVGGPLLVLDHLFTIALALALLGLCAAVGAAVIRRLRLQHDSAVETLAFAVAAGSGVLSTGILLCGAAGFLRPWHLGLLMVAAAAACRAEVVALPAVVAAAARELRRIAGRSATILLIAVGASMLLLALAPPSDYDSLMYHLRVPAQFVERGAIFLPEDSLHVAQVALTHMLYVPPIAFGAPSAGAVINVLFALALGAIVLSAAARWVSPSAGRTGAVLLWGSPILPLVASTLKVDATLAFYLVAGHVALLAAMRSAEHRGRWLVLAGALLGFAVGVKYPALAYVAALTPLVLAAGWTGSRTVGGAVRLVSSFAAACTVAMLPWLVKNWILLGGPLYPYFTDAVLPPWLAALHGTTTVPPDIDRESLRALVAVREPFALTAWFDNPSRLTPEAEGGSYRPNPAFLLVPFAVVLLRYAPFAALVVPGVIYAAAVVAWQPYTNLRYLIPAIPALTIAAAAVLSAVTDRLREPTVRAAIVGVVVAVSLAPSVQALTYKLVRTGAATHAAGLRSRDAYWRESRDVEVASHARLTAFVNERVPGSARLLLLFEGRGHGFETHVLQDNVVRNWAHLLPVLPRAGCLESAGITHVLVNTAVLGYFVSRGLDPERISWGRFDEFAARCLVLLEHGAGLALYAIEPRSTTASIHAE